MKGTGKLRQVTRGTISPEVRAARQARMAAAAAETRRALAAMWVAILARESEEGNYREDHKEEDSPSRQASPEGGKPS